MKKDRRHAFAFVTAVLLAGGALISHAVITAQAADYQPPLEDLRLFSDVYAHIKTEYVDEVDDNTLIEGAIRGMVKTLDPYSAFLTKREFDDLKISTTGKFGGLGIEVGMEEGLVRVIAPIDDSPAFRAGLLAGDLITQIDDEPVKGMSLSDAVDRMRGLVGTAVRLIIVRENEQPFEVEITRDVIKVNSVKHVLLDGVGYLRITKFQVDTPQLLVKALKDLKKQANAGAKGKLKGLILDLRSNPGGVLNAAVGVSDVFLAPDKLVVYTQGRQEDSRVEYMTRTSQRAGEIPVVVLVNMGSASASEIVAGALQDHMRARILGTQSFGKGSVQTVHPLDKFRAVKLTTAKYYTPLGRSIQDIGITPDLVLNSPAPAKQVAQNGENEAQEEASDTTPVKKLPLKRRDLGELLREDFQVQRAIQELSQHIQEAKKE